MLDTAQRWPEAVAKGITAAPVMAVQPEDAVWSQSPDTTVGETVFGLTPIEQLLLWSARRWRYGRFQWAQVETEFRRLLPDDWADALIAWETAMEQLHLFPTGWPDIGNGCRTSLSRDERALLTLTAVLQRQADGWASTAWLLGWLLPPARWRDITEPLLALSAALSRGGAYLPLHTPRAPR